MDGWEIIWDSEAVTKQTEASNKKVVKQASTPTTDPNDWGIVWDAKKAADAYTRLKPSNTTTSRTAKVGLVEPRYEVGKGHISGNQAYSVANKIKNKMLKAGYEPHQISGILGSMHQESSFDPSATNATSKAYGIAQWLGDRKTGLFDYASKKGVDPSNVDLQIDYLLHELENERTFIAKGGKDKIKKAANIDEVVDTFTLDFERPGKHELHMDRRRDYAKQIHNMFFK